MPKMQKTTLCRCRQTGIIRTAKSAEYRAFKNIMDAGRHPTFIGPEMFRTNARNGGAVFMEYEGKIIAAALVNPRKSSLVVLNVHPEHRKHGAGRFMVDYLACNFARVIDQAIPFFEKCGYKKLGKPFKGRSLMTWVMVRTSLIGLCGRMKKIYEKPLV